MPLEKPKKGATQKQKKAIASRNIEREIKAGVPRDKAIAIGMNAAGLSKKKKRKRRKTK